MKIVRFVFTSVDLLSGNLMQNIIRQKFAYADMIQLACCAVIVKHDISNSIDAGMFECLSVCMFVPSFFAAREVRFQTNQISPEIE